MENSEMKRYGPRTEPKTQSEELGELFAALAKAQGEMEVAKEESANPFFKSKYADLASVIKASRPCLAHNGLSVIQRVLPNDEGQLFLHTTLCHASGQWMEARMAITPPKSDIQALGGYITYLKRYMYSAIVGVVSSDEDDDGESAMSAAGERKPKSAAPDTKTINKAQLELLNKELEGAPEILEGILVGYQIDKLSDLLDKNYSKTMNRIRDIKMTEKK